MDRTDHEIGLRIKQICKRLGIPVGDLNRLAEIAPQLVIDPAGLSFGIRGRDYVFLDFNASARKKNLVLAHEMGHVLLGHLLTDHLARDESPCGEVIYRELLADVFSAVLMALCAYGAAGNDKEEK